MKRMKFLRLILVLWIFFILTAQFVYSLDYKANEIIIVTNKSIGTENQIQAINKKDPFLKKYKIRKTKKIRAKKKKAKFEIARKKILPEGNIYKFAFVDKIDAKKVSKEFLNHQDIAWAQPIYIYRTCSTANDYYYPNQWNIPLVNVDAAWDIEQGKSSIIVAVIDTGVDWLHEDLKNKIWANSGEIADNGIDDDNNGFIDDIRGWDFVSEISSYSGDDFAPRDNNPTDKQGHGTFVSGIIAAETNNSLGIAGVAPNCVIMPVRAGYKTSNNGGSFNNDDAADAIVYAADNGAQIINLSWGASASGGESDKIVEDAVNYAQTKGVIVVAAAGNESTDIDIDNFIPAYFDDVIAVSAIDATGNFDARYSNYGERVDISAPGTEILSTSYSSLHNNYSSDTGTSFATPHVSGIIALLLSKNSNVDVYEAITTMATDKGDPGRDEYYGYGVIDAYQTLGYVIPPSTSHTEIRAKSKGYNLPITANITDTIKGQAAISATLYYAYGTTANWQTQAMVTINSETEFQATIPTPAVDINDVYYYLKIADQNPNNTAYLPTNAPATTYQIVLNDVSGPSIASTVQDLDYHTSDQTLEFTLSDNTYVSPNTIEVGIISGSQTTSYNIASPEVTFNDPTLSIDLQSLSLAKGDYTFRISVTDIYNNTSLHTVSLILTNQTSEFALTGPDAATPVLNYPNPFNPNNQTTDICYMISKDADVEINIYSLNLELVKRIQSSEISGYHETIWDGKDEAGDQVPVGVYLMFIKATADGKTIVKRNKIAVVY
ncbi:S8 family serine peptidase [Candidatus Margulisiibacteriota bacterium]